MSQPLVQNKFYSCHSLAILQTCFRMSPGLEGLRRVGTPPGPVGSEDSCLGTARQGGGGAVRVNIRHEGSHWQRQEAIFAVYLLHIPFAWPGNQSPFDTHSTRNLDVKFITSMHVEPRQLVLKHCMHSWGILSVCVPASLSHSRSLSLSLSLCFCLSVCLPAYLPA